MTDMSRKEGTMWKTRATEILGIELPIVGGTMQWLSRAPFVAAISNAGGLGILPSATFSSKQELKDEIRRTKELTARPFAVNVNLFPMMRPFSVEEMIDAAHEEGVRILETSGRSPEPFIKLLRGDGAILMHKCARVRDAAKAETLGVDLVTVVGVECGGHPSSEEVTTLVLLPKTVESVKIPVLAGGGFADGRGFMAALALGAEGIVLGTRLMATLECPLHKAFKEELVKADVASTGLLLMSHKAPIRAYLNAVAHEILALEDKGADLQDILPKMTGVRGREAYEKGDLNGGIWPCGQAAGLVKEVLPVRDLFRKIMDEAEAIRRRWGAIETGP
jgi:nitronate monooxygenase